VDEIKFKLKMLGLLYGVHDDEMLLPCDGFAAVFNDMLASVFYRPDTIRTLELYDTERDIWFNVYKVFGGIIDPLISQHVTLTSDFVIKPSVIEIMAPTRVATIYRLDVFPVPQWKEL